MGIDSKRAECLCLAPGLKCHGCEVNAYIRRLEQALKNIVVYGEGCDFVRIAHEAVGNFDFDEILPICGDKVVTDQSPDCHPADCGVSNED